MLFPVSSIGGAAGIRYVPYVGTLLFVGVVYAGPRNGVAGCRQLFSYCTDGCILCST